VTAPELLPAATVAGQSGLLPPEPTRQRIAQAVEQAGARLRPSVARAGNEDGSSD